jgi:hypothetical protein
MNSSSDYGVIPFLYHNMHLGILVGFLWSILQTVALASVIAPPIPNKSETFSLD